MSLETTLQEDDGNSLLRVAMSGSLDSDTAPAFETTLDEVIAADWRLVVLDMRHLSYISSAGLRVVFKSAKALKQNGRSLAVANRQPQIEKVFEILQALPDMAVFANEQELDDYLDAMQKKTRGESFTD